LEGLNANYARTYKSSQSYLKGYEDGAKPREENLGYIRQYFGELDKTRLLRLESYGRYSIPLLH